MSFYGQNALATLGNALAALASLGLIVFLVGRFGKPEMFAVLILLAPMVLCLAAMYSGQMVLIGPATLPGNIQDHLFQVRLGAACVAPAAIFVATLAGGLTSHGIFRGSRKIFRFSLHP